MPTPNKMPTGGRKGGTTYPRVSLKQAVEYSRKVVGKTHTGPLAADLLLKGVFNSSGSRGKIRAAALKQFGLLEGDANLLSASDLAKKINSAPANEVTTLLQKACIAPKIFKQLYETFQHDRVSRAKIRQQALTLNVHPESAEECVNLFVESLANAGLAVLDSEDVVISANTSMQTPSSTDEPSGDGKIPNEVPPPTGSLAESDSEDDSGSEPGPDIQLVEAPASKTTISSAAQGISVTLSLDSTMDPDKLEKQLKLLRHYGVLK